MKIQLHCLVALVALVTPALAQGVSGPRAPRIQAPHSPGSLDLQAASSTADIRLMRLSADEKRLVYLADAERDEQLELYSLKPPGKHVVKLNAPFAPSRRGVLDFLISPDSRTVLYLADHAARDRYELFVVPVGGGPTVKIARPRLFGAIEQFSYWFTLDSRSVVFIDAVGGTRDLYVSPIDGGPTMKLSRSVGQVSAQSIRLSPDGQRVVYQSITPPGSSLRLWSAFLDGSADPILLRAGGATFGPVLCEISPDSALVVFGGSVGEIDVLSVPIDGSAAPVRLNGALPAGARVSSWHLSPDGARVVYLSNEEAVATVQVHSAPIDGSAPPVRLSDNTGNQLVFDYLTSPSGQVAFVTNPTSPRFFGLESAPLTGSTAPEDLSLPDENLSLTTDFGNFVGSWGPLVRITPDGARVLYASTAPSGQTSLSTAPADGSAAPTEIASLALGSLINIYLFIDPSTRPADLDFDPLGQRAVYIETAVDLDDANTTKLFSVPLDGSAPALELSGPRAATALGPRLFVISPRKGHVYYTADSLDAGVFELYTVPLDGSEAPRRLVDL